MNRKNDKTARNNPSEPPAIVFLDIDGVLNNQELCRKPGGRERFSPEAVEALREILETTGARIVLSSSWRTDIAHRIEPTFRANGLGDMFGRIIAHTPVIPDAPEETCRADEIDQWITSNPQYQDRFVVVDDDPCIKASFPGRHVLTNDETGLTRADAIKAIGILSR